MYFEALKIFCDVVRLNSFSRAAAVNRISQSAVSQNVLQLEKGLGVQAPGPLQAAVPIDA